MITIEFVQSFLNVVIALFILQLAKLKLPTDLAKPIHFITGN